VVFQIVRKCKFPIINNIVMAEQVVALEVVGGKDVVEGVCQVGQFSKLPVEILLEELNSGLVVEFVCLVEVKEVALFLEELQLAVGLLQSLIIFL
jgi:hypothetical protein